MCTYAAGSPKLPVATSEYPHRSTGFGPCDPADQDQSSAPFGEYREIIVAILDTYNYEDVLLTTTNNILATDLYYSTLHQGEAATWRAHA